MPYDDSLVDQFRRDSLMKALGQLPTESQTDEPDFSKSERYDERNNPEYFKPSDVETADSLLRKDDGSSSLWHGRAKPGDPWVGSEDPLDPENMKNWQEKSSGLISGFSGPSHLGPVAGSLRMPNDFRRVISSILDRSYESSPPNFFEDAFVKGLGSYPNFAEEILPALSNLNSAGIRPKMPANERTIFSDTPFIDVLSDRSNPESRARALKVLEDNEGQTRGYNDDQFHDFRQAIGKPYSPLSEDEVKGISNILGVPIEEWSTPNKRDGSGVAGQFLKYISRNPTSKEYDPAGYVPINEVRGAAIQDQFLNLSQYLTHFNKMTPIEKIDNLKLLDIPTDGLKYTDAPKELADAMWSRVQHRLDQLENETGKSFPNLSSSFKKTFLDYREGQKNR